MNNKLPQDLLTFLDQGKQLIYNFDESEVGMVTLKKKEQLTEEAIFLEKESSPHSDADPNKEKSGYYSVPAIDLIQTCDDSYDPHGILLWLPTIGMYGTWDSDHYQLIGFPGVDWGKITENPAKYLNAQWDPAIGDGEYIAGWKYGQFQEGRPF